jgi:hypothetical protein
VWKLKWLIKLVDHYLESLLTIKSLYPLDLTNPLKQNSFLTPVYLPSSSTWKIKKDSYLGNGDLDGGSVTRVQDFVGVNAFSGNV